MKQSALTAAPGAPALDALRRSLTQADGEPARPKWRLLFDALCEAIASGRFQPGDRLPPETAMAPALDLSVGTVRKALDELTSAGLIVRHRKAGSFVTDRSAKASEVFVYRFTDPDSGQLALPFVRTLAVEEDFSAGPWTYFLETDRAVRVDRRVWIDNEPPALSSVYFQPAHGAALLERSVADVGHMSMHRMLIERFGLPTMRMAHTIASGPLPLTVCAELSLPPHTVGTIWDIRDHTLADAPLVFQRYHLPPGHRPIELHERVGPILASQAGGRHRTSHNQRDETP